MEHCALLSHLEQLRLPGHWPLVDDSQTRSASATSRRTWDAYLNSVLWISVPTGLLISINAKGGWPSTLGFALTGVLWWWATWAGYRAIVRNQLVTHICWMVRSYALALSAVAFRVVQQLMALGPLSDVTNYVISIWVSLLISLWISETCIKRHFANPAKSKNVPKRFTFNRRPASKIKPMVSSL